MDELSRARATRAYRALVYETPDFVDYFRAATPIAEIAELNIGSRPASRTASTRIEDLRAIPWVFSWGQCRLMLPGWYGFGTAVDAWLAAHADGAARARAARRDARALAVLPQRAVEHGHGARQDRPRDRVALRRAGARRRACATRSSARIAAEHGAHGPRTCSRSPAQATLLDDNPTLARSIRNRFPYLDPLNHLQVELLRRYRAGQTDERTQRAIHLTINGLAAGLRNSG